MIDLRQGVTPTQHAVLDMIEEKAAIWGHPDYFDFDGQLAMAVARGKSALRTTSLANKHRFAIEAAARFIDAADEVGRLLSEEQSACPTT